MEDNIRADLKEMCFHSADWIHLAKDNELVSDSYEHDNRTFDLYKIKQIISK
jgi:hypothetical protein